MEFLYWHYTFGVDFYLSRFKNIILGVSHYFSPFLLISHLFSPWKKLIEDKSVRGISLEKRFEIVSFNFVSRGIGAFVRLLLCIVSLVALIFVFFVGIIGLFVWIVIPFLSLPLYQLFRKQPKYVCDAIKKSLASGKKPFDAVFNSDPGRFVLNHLSLSSDEALNIFDINSFSIDEKTDTFEALIGEYLSQNEKIEEKLLEKSLTKKHVLLSAMWWDRRRSAKTLIDSKPPYKSIGIGRSLLYGYTPILDEYSTDMGLVQEFGHHLIGREKTVNRIERALKSSSVILTGVSGVGKKTVIYELAKRAREGQLGETMSYKTFFLFDYTSIIAGATDFSQKKVILGRALAEASYAGNVVLVLRDIERLTVSELEGVDMTDVLEQYLEGGKLKIIAIEDPSQFERYVQPNTRLRKFFETIEVTSMNKEDALIVLLDGARAWEKKEDIVITSNAIISILDGSERYITDTPFPEKALELLDSVVTFAIDNSVSVIAEDHVQTVLSEKTGVTLTSLKTSDKEKLSNLEALIHERLINQEEAVYLIAQTLRAKTSGVTTNRRPIGSFLFLGPTGVGKTETAKALATVYFGSESQMIRLNMAEYQGDEGISRLIGSLNNGVPGQLTSAIRKSPANLLLLDEIEKAPKEVVNLLLALLDEGQITDVFGKSYDCSHLFVIATSNAGAEFIRDGVKSGKSSLTNELMDKLIHEKIFSPELLNRFDGVVVYKPLSTEHLKEVAKMMIKSFANNLKTKNIFVEINSEALEKIVSLGYDPSLGARPMRRVIDITLGDLIGAAIISNEIKSGDHILIRPDGGRIGFVWEKI